MIESLNEYQELSSRTMRPGMAPEEKNKYCCMKLAEEVGEINAAFAKHYFHGKPFDRDNLLAELGDTLWYVANLAAANGFTMAEVATYNIDKLKKRHGEKFNPEFYQKGEAQ